MADGVTLNAGTGGATLATDDAGLAGHVQVVKLAISTDASATVIPADEANGLDVDVTRVGSGDNTIGRVKITDGTDVALVNASGHLLTEVATALPAGTNAIGKLAANSGVDIGDVDVTSFPATVHSADYDTGAGTDTTLAFGIAVPASGGAVVVPGDATAGLKVDLGADNDVTVTGTVTANLAAGTNNIGDVDILSIAAGDNNIGNVDIVTMPNVTLAAGTNTNEVVGDIAHDTGVSGNPVQIAGAAQDMDDTAPPNRVSAESDVTRLATDRDGTQFVHPHGPQIWSYHDDDAAAVTTDGTVHAAPGAGLSLYVTDIVFSIGAATASSIFFEEGTTKVLGPYYLEAIAGRGMALHFQTPKKITANTALLVTNTGSISFSVDVTGFTAQG